MARKTKTRSSNQRKRGTKTRNIVYGSGIQKRANLSKDLSVSPSLSRRQLREHKWECTSCAMPSASSTMRRLRFSRTAIKCAGRTPQHIEESEITFDITIDDQFEVKKNGCEEGFPFFIVPSLLDKKMSGPFQLTVYSDKDIVIQMLDDSARKL